MVEVTRVLTSDPVAVPLIIPVRRHFLSPAWAHVLAKAVNTVSESTRSKEFDYGTVSEKGPCAIIVGSAHHSFPI